MDTIEIRVCNKGGACSFCGKPPAVAGGTWATLTCQGGAIEGDQIKLVNPAHHLQFCEMKIYGRSKLDTFAAVFALWCQKAKAS